VTQSNNKQEFTMSTLSIGRRLIPVEQIALIEPFDEASRENLKSEKPFQTRVVLLNRESVLTEDALTVIAEQNGFRLLKEDGVATNPGVPFSVEAFEPVGDFKPTKAYRSRILWRDQSGKAQSKLLLTAPEDVLATAVRGIEGQIVGRAAPRARRSGRKARSPTL
jgi:hypothetical protein